MATIFFNHNQANIVQPTFNFHEFVPTYKKPGFSIILFQRYMIEKCQNLTGQEHFGSYLRGQIFSKYTTSADLSQII